MSDREGELDEGGEAACYANLVCAECGAVLDESHPASCPGGAAGASE